MFALGGVIVKSSHLRREHPSTRDYSRPDQDEVKAIELAMEAPAAAGVRAPTIYFADKINGRDVLIQEPIPGVGLSVAWLYLSHSQKASFKEQARSTLKRLHSMTPPSSLGKRQYVVFDPNPVRHGGIQDLENELLFSSTELDMRFIQNGFSMSNTIVDNDRIAGFLDWEMAGWFGWKTAQNVHIHIRSPRRENYAGLDLLKEALDDLLFWNDLYTV